MEPARAMVVEPGTTVNCENGVEVPMPTLPIAETAREAVVEDTRKSGLVCPEIAWIERLAHGVDEPTPRKPCEVIVVVPVLPKEAMFARSALAKKVPVEVAPVKVAPANESVVVVAFEGNGYAKVVPEVK